MTLHAPRVCRDKIKQAQQMFNPEMMKKYSEVGVKVQALQAELAQTEVECATKDGSTFPRGLECARRVGRAADSVCAWRPVAGVVVKVSGTQVRPKAHQRRRSLPACSCPSGRRRFR